MTLGVARAVMTREPVGDAPSDVTIDATAHYTSTENLASHSFNHVIGATANKILIGITAEGSLPRDIESVTVGGVAATRTLASQVISSDDEQVWLYDLDNPPTGTQSIVVTRGGGVGIMLQVTSVSLIGAAAGAPEDTGSNIATGSPSLVVLAPSAGAILLDWLIIQGSSAITAGADQTQIANVDGAFHPHGCSSQSAADGGDMSWTIGVSSATRAHLAVSVAPG